nr:hypothetical protein Iba_chr11eCG7250 [Ipomoea batatas]
MRGGKDPQKLKTIAAAAHDYENDPINGIPLRRRRSLLAQVLPEIQIAKATTGSPLGQSSPNPVCNLLLRFLFSQLVKSQSFQLPQPTPGRSVLQTTSALLHLWKR